jgi:uncharacterized protein YndB with AHSA1/START domain
MARLSVEATGTARADPETVWALVADATSYPRWGPWDEGGYERPGDESPHGAGAVRWLRWGRTTTVERLLEVDDGRRVAYTVVRGIPVRNYRAEVTLTALESGTRVDWTAAWDRTLAGRVVQWTLRTVYPEVVARLVAAADRGASAA